MPEKEIHETPMSNIQPSQLYINENKLKKVEEKIEERGVDSLEPIPIKRLSSKDNGYVFMTDGHTRAVGLLRNGYKKCQTVWETDQLDWEAYEICIRWCRKEGIREPIDLLDRIVSDKVYQKLWLDRCHMMHERLESKSLNRK